MTNLTLQEMQDVRGGSLCGMLRSITLLSCMTGMLVACGIGLAGGAAAC